MSLDIVSILDPIEQHIHEQPYAVVCSKCGENLRIANRRWDAEHDVTAFVDPCANEKCPSKTGPGQAES